MDIQKALWIVHELADQNKLSRSEGTKTPEVTQECKMQQEALDTVLGFVENY